MAEVYLALSGELTGFRTLVVVKRILPHLAENHDFISMFLDEARIAALLDHPNVVRIIEVGHDGDEYFLVMELVQGKPLAGVLRKAAKEQSPLTPALAAFVVAQAAGGLGYAHNLVGPSGEPLNIVHRDVSPQNILVSFEGAVKLIDFGVARALGRVTHTNPGGLKGKIEYMSPEQAGADEVDRRADVFALGVVLWEALTGRHLFRRQTELATMRAIVDDPIPRPSEIISIAPVLEAIVMRALKKRREERFQSAQELAMALERYAFASEGFSPLQLATYMKGLFAVEFTEWKKTVSSALEMDGKSKTPSGQSFPVVKPDLPTRGPTVALRPNRLPVAEGETPALELPAAATAAPVTQTAVVSEAPSKGDRLWVYGGVAALGMIVLAGVLVLSQPAAAPPPPPSRAAVAAPAAAPSTRMATSARTGTGAGTGAGMETGTEGAKDETKVERDESHGSRSSRSRSHGHGHGTKGSRGSSATDGAGSAPFVDPFEQVPPKRGESGSAKEPAAPSGHRPNPFE
jgi:serine/threonine-protein kinase